MNQFIPHLDAAPHKSRSKIQERRARHIHLLLVLSLFMSLMPTAALVAAPAHQTTETDGNCVRSTSEQNSGGIFLPFISSAQDVLTGAASALPAPLSAPLDAPRTISWEAGKTYLYDYAIEVNTNGFRRDAEGPAQSTSSSKSVIDMVAEIAITQVKEDGTAVGQIVLNDPFICTTDTGTTDAESETVVDDTALESELAKPLLFEQAPNGTITAVSLPEDSQTEPTNIQKGVINALQMTLQADADSYDVAEVGGQGTYTATYTLADDGDNLSISKSYGTGSFSELRTAGNAGIGSITMNTAIDALLDGSRGIITSVSATESIATGDGVEEPDGSNQGFGGATAWTEIDSTTKLTFKSVSDSPNIQAASLLAPYIADDLGADFTENATQNMAGVTLEGIDLAAEVTALAESPTDPTLFLRIMDLAAVDEEAAVLDAVQTALNANLDDEAASSVLIDVLTAMETPAAQAILAGIIDPSASVGAASLSSVATLPTRRKALINTVMLTEPITKTVLSIQNLSQSEDELADIAIAALGAAADKLGNSDPQMAASITNELLASLGSAENEQDVSVYLGALGNAASEETVDEISTYLTETLTLNGGAIVTDTLGLQYAAYSALGRIPGQQSEDLLVAALNDSSGLLATRLTILNLLPERENLSEAALSALSANASLGNTGTEDGSVHASELDGAGLAISRVWNRTFGNSSLGVRLPGNFTIQTPAANANNGFFLFARQRVNSMILGNTSNLADGRLLVERIVNPGQPSFIPQHRLRIDLDLLNYSVPIAPYIRQFVCSLDESGTLWSGSRAQTRTLSVSILSLISVNTQFRTSLNYSLDYNYDVNACNVVLLGPNNTVDLTAEGAIIPNGRATAFASSSLQLTAVRGGVSANATILDTEVDLSLNATQTISRFGPVASQVCIDVDLMTQALSGRITAWADTWRPRPTFTNPFRGEWRRQYTGTLATFSTPTRNINIWDRCWQ